MRPQPGADATAARAAALGLKARVTPLFAIESTAWDPPDPSRFDALLLTSANALRHAGPRLSTLRSLPAMTVGEATAAAAREAGLTVAAVGEDDAASLLASLPLPLRMLHLCGEDVTSSDSVGHHVEHCRVYRAVAVPDPGPLALSGQVVLVHSSRAACRLAELVTDRATIRIAAISSAAAAASGLGWEHIASAETPTDAALLALAARLCQDKAQ